MTDALWSFLILTACTWALMYAAWLLHDRIRKVLRHRRGLAAEVERHG